MNSNYFKCKRCGSFINKLDGIEIANNKGMICSECMRNLNYSTKNNLRVKKETKSGKTYGFELECIPKSKNHKAFMLQPQYNLKATKDSSLPPNGVEFKTPTYNSLRGLRKTFHTFNEHVRFNNAKCGQHINIGDKKYINEHSMQLLRHYGRVIFDGLYDYMYEHKEETIKVCGRFFNDYALRSINYISHCSWVNLSHNNRIEFRLSKFVTPNQYFTLTCMWTDMLNCIINNLINTYNWHDSGTPADYSKYFRDCSKVSNKLIKIFKRYARCTDC